MHSNLLISGLSASMRQIGRGSRQQNGFTAFSLIELLVALTVIAILSAILIPAVSRVRVAPLQAKNTVQLREIGMAVRLFATEHGGMLPQFGYPASNTRGPNADWRSPARALFAAENKNLGSEHPLGSGDYLSDINVFYSPLLSKMTDWRSDGKFYNRDGSNMIGYFLYSLPSGVAGGRNPIRYNGQPISNESADDWGRSPLYSDFQEPYATDYGFQGNKFFVLHLDGSVSSRDASVVRHLYQTNLSRCYYYMATGHDI